MPLLSGLAFVYALDYKRILRLLFMIIAASGMSFASRSMEASVEKLYFCDISASQMTAKAR